MTLSRDHPIDSPLDTVLSSRILNVLGTVVLEPIDTSGSFRIRGEAPSWWVGVFGEAGSIDTPFVPDIHAPFLNHFMKEAAQAWSAPDTESRKSGTWMERDAQGIAWPFEATALSIGPHQLLLLSRLGTEFDQAAGILQQARDRALVHERTVKTLQHTKTTLYGQLQESLEERDDLLSILQQLGLACLLADRAGHVTLISRPAAQLLEVRERSGTATTLDDLTGCSPGELAMLQDLLRHSASSRRTHMVSLSTSN